MIKVERGNLLQDAKLIDLIVQIANHEPVSVQVKSSEIMLQRFFQRHKRIRRARRRLIGLNTGPESAEEDIVAAFLTQLKKLDGYV